MHLINKLKDVSKDIKKDAKFVVFHCMLSNMKKDPWVISLTAGV